MDHSNGHMHTHPNDQYVANHMMSHTFDIRNTGNSNPMLQMQELPDLSNLPELPIQSTDKTLLVQQGCFVFNINLKQSHASPLDNTALAGDILDGLFGDDRNFEVDEITLTDVGDNRIVKDVNGNMISTQKMMLTVDATSKTDLIIKTDEFNIESNHFPGISIMLWYIYAGMDSSYRFQSFEYSEPSLNWGDDGMPYNYVQLKRDNFSDRAPVEESRWRLKINLRAIFPYVRVDELSKALKEEAMKRVLFLGSKSVTLVGKFGLEQLFGDVYHLHPYPYVAQGLTVTIYEKTLDTFISDQNDEEMIRKLYQEGPMIIVARKKVIVKDQLVALNFGNVVDMFPNVKAIGVDLSAKYDNVKFTDALKEKIFESVQDALLQLSQRKRPLSECSPIVEPSKWKYFYSYVNKLYVPNNSGTKPTLALLDQKKDIANLAPVTTILGTLLITFWARLVEFVLKQSPLILNPDWTYCIYLDNYSRPAPLCFKKSATNKDGVVEIINLTMSLTKDMLEMDEEALINMLGATSTSDPFPKLRLLGLYSTLLCDMLHKCVYHNIWPPSNVTPSQIFGTFNKFLSSYTNASSSVTNVNNVIRNTLQWICLSVDGHTAPNPRQLSIRNLCNKVSQTYLLPASPLTASTSFITPNGGIDSTLSPTPVPTPVPIAVPVPAPVPAPAPVPSPAPVPATSVAKPPLKLPEPLPNTSTPTPVPVAVPKPLVSTTTSPTGVTESRKEVSIPSVPKLPAVSEMPVPVSVEPVKKLLELPPSNSPVTIPPSTTQVASIPESAITKESKDFDTHQKEPIRKKQKVEEVYTNYDDISAFSEFFFFK